MVTPKSSAARIISAGRKMSYLGRCLRLSVGGGPTEATRRARNASAAAEAAGTALARVGEQINGVQNRF
jgi:hypothetical protein